LPSTEASLTMVFSLCCQRARCTGFMSMWAVSPSVLTKSDACNALADPVEPKGTGNKNSCLRFSIPGPSARHVPAFSGCALGCMRAKESNFDALRSGPSAPADSPSNISVHPFAKQSISSTSALIAAGKPRGAPAAAADLIRESPCREPAACTSEVRFLKTSGRGGVLSREVARDG